MTDRILECFSPESQSSSSSSPSCSGPFPGLGFSRMNQSLKAQFCLKQHACHVPSLFLEALKHLFEPLILFIPRLLKAGACPASRWQLEARDRGSTAGLTEGWAAVILGDRFKKGLYESSGP